MRDSGLELAIKAVGGISALARALGVAQPSVSNWSRVPAERVLAVEALSSVDRHVLRPDLYPAPEPGAAPDDVEAARGRVYLLLANLLREAPTSLTLMELASLEAGEGDALARAIAALGEAARGADADRLAAEHFGLFVGLGRSELVPYASYYRTGFLYERPLVNVREDLKVIGLARAGESNDPEDSAAFLCEVMAGMALGHFPASPQFEQRFFQQHLAPWVERFFNDLAAVETSAFYRAVGDVGRIFISLERDAFAIDAAPAHGEHPHRDIGPEDHHDRKAS